MLIPLDQGKPGMTLRAAATDARGRLILAQGEKLDEHILQRLARFGVSKIDVDVGDEPAAPEPEFFPAGVTPESIRKNIGQRFAPMADDPRMAAIRDALLKHLPPS